LGTSHNPAGMDDFATCAWIFKLRAETIEKEFLDRPREGIAYLVVLTITIIAGI
jgi:hypothetical protein